jgi:hypothetical protein
MRFAGNASFRRTRFENQGDRREAAVALIRSIRNASRIRAGVVLTYSGPVAGAVASHTGCSRHAD